MALTFSESVTLHRHLRIGEHWSYLNSAPLQQLRDPSTPAPTIDPATGRSDQRFVVEVRLGRGAGSAVSTISGRDIYASTAPLLVEGALRLLAEGPRRVGAVAPGQAFAAGPLLDALTTGPSALQLSRR